MSETGSIPKQPVIEVQKDRVPTLADHGGHPLSGQDPVAAGAVGSSLADGDRRGRDAPGVASQPQPRSDWKLNYEAGSGRRVIFSALFLLLLPFFVSLVPMIYSRLVHQHWIGTPGLILLAICFAIVMFLIVIELMFSIRSNVAFTDDAVRLTLPSGRGPTPMLKYASHVIPYTDVELVETRREVYGGALAPIMLKGARVVKKDGEMVKLGYVSEANADPCMPYPDIAAQIAHRAGVSVVDRGCVNRTVKGKMFGLASLPEENAPVEERELEQLNARHKRVVNVLIAGLAALVAFGIIADIVSK